jgi:hypothetical protein
MISPLGDNDTMNGMTKYGNPYRPGSGVRPCYLAGRDRVVSRFARMLRGAPAIPANLRLTGLRGVGKTVLLKTLEQLALQAGWMTSRVQLEPRHNRDDEVAGLIRDVAHNAILRISKVERARDAVRQAAAVLSTVRVSWQDIELSMTPRTSPGSPQIAKSLYDVVSAAVRGGHRGYLLMLDEAQILRDERGGVQTHPLSLLVAAINTLQEYSVPLGLVLSGLPSLTANLLRARTYTERMFRGEEIARLDKSAAWEAFTRPLDETGMTAEPELVQRVVSEVEGFPYFIQLWGAELWDGAREAGAARLTADLLDAIEPDIYRRLDIDFYDGRVEALTPAEQDLLIGAADCPYPPLRTSDVQSKTHRSTGNVNVLMGRLVEQGVLYRLQKGAYGYTAPKFHEYLRRRAARRLEP